MAGTFLLKRARRELINVPLVWSRALDATRLLPTLLRPPASSAVTVALQGGLGNQMFQFAAGLSVAARRNSTVALDRTWFDVAHVLKQVTPREYGLDAFGLSASTDPLVQSPEGWFLAAKLRDVMRIERSYFENSIAFDPRFELLQTPVRLVGYFQSEKYFSNVSDVIRGIFSRPATLTEEIHQFAVSIANQCSLAVHVRRGDAVSNPVSAAYHGACDIGYYYAGVERVRSRFPDVHTFVFSDDIGWCQQNLIFDSPVTFVSVCDSNVPSQDLWLMSQCDHFVISNSSYSWWAAWLGQSPSKLVIAPKRWLRDPRRISPDLIPSSWVSI